MTARTILALSLLAALACAPSAAATPPSCPTGPSPVPDGVNQCIADASAVAVGAINHASTAAQAAVVFGGGAALYVSNAAGGALVSGGNFAQWVYHTAFTTASNTADMAIQLASGKTQETISFATCTVFGNPPTPCKSPVPPPR
jgi:hypothetical protein